MSKLYPRLKPLYIELLRISWGNSATATGVLLGAFSLENENVQRVLGELAKKCVDIEATTEEAIQRIIGEAAEAGWSKERTASEIIERGVIQNPARADMIAHTEMADAYERGSHLYYQETGQVAGTEWLIGPEPCELCEPLSGKVVPLGDEFADGVTHPPYHPRCTCSTAPILSEREKS